MQHNKYFLNDYGTGAHPSVLEAISQTNDNLTKGYGEDQYCEAAADQIRRVG